MTQEKFLFHPLDGDKNLDKAVRLTEEKFVRVATKTFTVIYTVKKPAIFILTLVDFLTENNFIINIIEKILAEYFYSVFEYTIMEVPKAVLVTGLWLLS